MGIDKGDKERFVSMVKEYKEMITGIGKFEGFKQ